MEVVSGYGLITWGNLRHRTSETTTILRQESSDLKGLYTRRTLRGIFPQFCKMFHGLFFYSWEWR